MAYVIGGDSCSILFSVLAPLVVYCAFQTRFQIQKFNRSSFNKIRVSFPQMSSSTVSIREKLRRRTTLPPADQVPAVEHEPVASTPKSNPSHSLRGDVFFTPKKAPSPATAPVSATHTRRTSRKTVVKPERNKWVAVISVVSKNLLLLILLIGLVQLVRNLVYDKSEGVGVEVGSEFERRIADVEGLLKKVTKMLQVEVEVVDAKVEKGLSEVRLDLTKRIDDKGAEFVSELKKFEGSVGNLEKDFNELRSVEWLKKEEFDGFIDEFRKMKGGESSSAVNLDEVREMARAIVERELEKRAADGLGRADYALATGGAAVVRHSKAYAVGRGIGLFERVKEGVHGDAVKMLSPSFGEPGQCFALKGSSGFVEIRLRTAIIPDAVTLEHVAKSVAFDRSSAPKDCQITGWLKKHDITESTVNTEQKTLLTEFTYDLEKSNAQTFDVVGTTVVIDTIRLDFTSNHGNPAHTCIYRLRVHGHEPDSTSIVG